MRNPPEKRRRSIWAGARCGSISVQGNRADHRGDDRDREDREAPQREETQKKQPTTVREAPPTPFGHPTDET